MKEDSNSVNTKTKPMNKIVDKIKPLYQKIDFKLIKLVPNDKLRKVIIYTLVGFILFIVLILTLAIIASITQPKRDTGYFLNKPSITQSSPEPNTPKTPVQQELMNLKNEINNLKFPLSELTVPEIVQGIIIE